MCDIPHLIDGRALRAPAAHGDLFDPNTGEAQARVGLADAESRLEGESSFITPTMR